MSDEPRTQLDVALARVRAEQDADVEVPVARFGSAF